MWLSPAEIIFTCVKNRKKGHGEKRREPQGAGGDWIRGEGGKDGHCLCACRRQHDALALWRAV
eukprot:3156194-Pleurochrysis_carterae.AAC.3